MLDFVPLVSRRVSVLLLVLFLFVDFLPSFSFLLSFFFLFFSFLFLFLSSLVLLFFLVSFSPEWRRLNTLPRLPSPLCVLCARM